MNNILLRSIFATDVTVTITICFFTNSFYRIGNTFYHYNNTEISVLLLFADVPVNDPQHFQSVQILHGSESRSETSVCLKLWSSCYIPTAQNHTYRTLHANPALQAIIRDCTSCMSRQQNRRLYCTVQLYSNALRVIVSERDNGFVLLLFAPPLLTNAINVRTRFHFCLPGPSLPKTIFRMFGWFDRLYRENL